MKKVPKLLREKHFSDYDHSFFVKTTNVKICNKNNKKNKASNDNKIKITKKKDNNNKKPFSLSSKREKNNENNNDKNKNEKMQENIIKMKSFTNNMGKYINFCGNNKDNLCS